MNTQEKVVAEIKNTFSALKNALSRFSGGKLNSVRFEGSWTAGQVTEHIIKSIGGIPDRKTKEADRPFDEKIDTIRNLFLNMEMKFKAAPVLEPEHSHHGLGDLLGTLSQLEKQHIRSASELNLEVLCLDMELPGFGYLTRYEWLRFMMAHTQRHTKQIENIYETLKL